MAKFVQMSNVVVSVLAKLPLVVNVVRMAINHNKINMIIDQLLAIAIAVPRCAGRFVFADDGAAMIIMDTIIIFIIIIVSVIVVVA